MRDEWEYLVRLNVKGEFVMRLPATGAIDAIERVYDQMREVLPGWCAIQIEEAKKADPPSMKYLLREQLPYEEVSND